MSSSSCSRSYHVTVILLQSISANQQERSEISLLEETGKNFSRNSCAELSLGRPAHLASALGAFKSTWAVQKMPSNAPFDTERVRWEGRAILEPLVPSSPEKHAQNEEKEE